LCRPGTELPFAIGLDRNIVAQNGPQIIEVAFFVGHGDQLPVAVSGGIVIPKIWSALSSARPDAGAVEATTAATVADATSNKVIPVIACLLHSQVMGMLPTARDQLGPPHQSALRAISAPFECRIAFDIQNSAFAMSRTAAFMPGLAATVSSSCALRRPAMTIWFPSL